jgi:predicted RNase H-like HicB family nuclease
MTAFTFTGLILAGADVYSSLCPELDVASRGDTVERAKEMLLEAVTLYLETAIESNLPTMRPVPPDEDPRRVLPEEVLDVFTL